MTTRSLPSQADPTVTVVIPAYNAANYVSAAIESVLAQTYPPLEILVVDDGSHDQTPEMVNRFPAPVRLVRKTNGGPASARNLAAREARGEWLAFLDADDTWLPDKLQRQMEYAQANVALIHCLYRTSRAPAVPDRVTFDDLWKRNCIACSTVVIRRSLFLHLGGFDEDPRLIGVEDYHLWMRVAATPSLIVTVQDILIHYTPAPGSLTQQVERFAQAELLNLRKIGTQLAIERSRLRQKELQILDEYGRELLHSRDLSVARRFLRNALTRDFSFSRLAWWSATFLPHAAFHLYGNLRYQRP